MLIAAILVGPSCPDWVPDWICFAILQQPTVLVALGLAIATAVALRQTVSR